MSCQLSFAGMDRTISLNVSSWSFLCNLTDKSSMDILLCCANRSWDAASCGGVHKLPAGSIPTSSGSSYQFVALNSGGSFDFTGPEGGRWDKLDALPDWSWGSLASGSILLTRVLSIKYIYHWFWCVSQDSSHWLQFRVLDWLTDVMARFCGSY